MNTSKTKIFLRIQFLIKIKYIFGIYYFSKNILRFRIKADYCYLDKNADVISLYYL